MKNDKSNILNYIYKNNLLISPDVLPNISKEEIKQIINLFQNEFSNNIKPLVINKEFLNIKNNFDSNNLNWIEYEKSKVDIERGNKNDVYNVFNKIISLDHIASESDNHNLNENTINENYTKGQLDQSNNVIIIKSYNCNAEKRDEKDFIKYYNARYQALKNILMNRPDLKNAVSINKLSYIKGKVTLIGLVMDKSTTKNNNIMLTLEDPTGKINIIINKNKNDLYQIAKDISYDEAIGVVGDYSNSIIFAENIYYPDLPLNNNLKKSEDEVYVAFISDIHVGSQKFLKYEFQIFIDWLNCNYGNDKQKSIAQKTKYLFIIGDTVAGVGVYPGQDEELEIKDIVEQYKELARYLKQIKSDVKIIMCAGNHDATRIAEPQPPPLREYAPGLYEIENLILVSNPCLVNIHSNENFDGFNILMYHGASFHYFVDNVERLRQQKARDNPSIIMKYLLQRRHLAPSHGSTLIIPDINNDFLVIDKIPDIVVSGDMHKSDVSKYCGVTIINCSCWESKTDFQEKTGNNPDPCKVPIINLKTREVKIMRFDKLD